MAQSAMFAGLVFDEDGNPADTAWVGENACYIIVDDDFRRHIDAGDVDRQVLRFLRQQVEGSRDLAVKTMLDMMGQDDVFTKAAVESSIDRMEEAVGQPIPRGSTPVAGHARLPHHCGLSRQHRRHRDAGWSDRRRRVAGNLSMYQQCPCVQWRLRTSARLHIDLCAQLRSDLRQNRWSHSH